jgi:hypothetical protein
VTIDVHRSGARYGSKADAWRVVTTLFISYKKADRDLGGRRQPTRPKWVQEWLKTANLALAHAVMLSSYVEECDNLS